MGERNRDYLKATDTRDFEACRRYFYLDLFGDLDEKDEEVSDFAAEQMSKGKEHELAVTKAMGYELEFGPGLDMEELFASTLEAMRSGVSGIAQGALMHEERRGIPDFLERVDGPSELGDFHYTVGDAKISKEAKPHHLLQLLFYARLLERIQGRLPDRCFLVLQDGGRTDIPIGDCLALEDRMNMMVSVFEGKEEPEAVIMAKCKDCGWAGVCVAEALASGDVTLVEGIKEQQKAALAELGIMTVRDLADADLTGIKLPRVGEKRLPRIQRRAQAWAEDRSILLEPLDLPAGKEIHYDVETFPELGNLVYLHGILIVDGGDTEYRCFFADSVEEEEEALRQTLALFRSFENPVIYHYAHYEKSMLKELMAKYGALKDDIQWLLESGVMVDLCGILKQKAALPLISYSLKQVAPRAGFRWSGEVGSADQSMVFYQRFMETGDEKLKNDIIQYNRDDVLATYNVLRWLEKLPVEA